MYLYIVYTVSYPHTILILFSYYSHTNVCAVGDAGAKEDGASERASRERERESCQLHVPVRSGLNKRYLVRIISTVFLAISTVYLIIIDIL